VKRTKGWKRGRWVGNNLLGQGRRWKGKVKGGIKEREEKGSLYFYG